MKRMVLLVIALGAAGMFVTKPAAAQVRVGFGVDLWRPPLSGYIVVGSRFGYAPRPLLVEVVRPYRYYRPYGGGWYRTYRPVARYERVRVYRPHRRGRRGGW